VTGSVRDGSPRAGSPDPRVFVLGAGRAGLALARGLRDGGVAVVGVHGRHAARGVSAGPLPAGLHDATAVLVAVRDAQLDAALAELAPALGPGAVVLHLSGASDPAGLVPLRASGHPCGTFHPLVPLAPESDVAALLRGAWFGVDGDDAAIATSTTLAHALGAHVLRIPPGEKARYHAAAVLASNYPVVLAALAERLMREAGVEAAAARGAVTTLLAGAASNARGLAPERPFTATLTGPMVRGDLATVDRHLDALAGDPVLADVYRALAQATAGLLGGATPRTR
jgi:predicted short-subunit dehydrogenase-like oxidoreductase (DUF2520 family)